VLGKSLVLSLEDPSGGHFSLESTPIEGPIWKTRLKDFSEIAGLETAQVLPSAFGLSIAGEAKLGAPKRLMFVTIPSELRRDGLSTITVELTEPAAIVRGSLALEFELPRNFVETYADLHLEIAIGVGSGQLSIATYSLRDWPSGTRRLEIPIVAAAEGQIEFGSVIQLRLTSSV
jgi:hypothetical protein